MLKSKTENNTIQQNLTSSYILQGLSMMIPIVIQQILILAEPLYYYKLNRESTNRKLALTNTIWIVQAQQPR